MTGGAGLVVTTSWDDGHVQDVGLAELLEAAGVCGTFYVAPRSLEIDAGHRLSSAQVCDLSSRFEIGGHTLTHRRLPTLEPQAAQREIVDGKRELEDTIGAALQSFCYPGGEYDASHVEMVRAAGFRVARTVERFVTTAPTDLLRLGTAVHAYRHLVDVPMRHRRLRDPRRALSCWRNWDDLAIALFDQTRALGGVYHLWGHSWEVRARGDWGRLERVLRHIGRQPGVSYVTNGQLASMDFAGGGS